MATPTDAELLVAVKTAILNQLSRGAKKIEKADHGVEGLPLSELIKLRKDLEARIAKDGTGNEAHVVRFREPR